jgi:hypothetical protein
MSEQRVEGGEAATASIPTGDEVECAVAERAAAKLVAAERDALLEELEAAQAVLTSNGNVGMKGSLVDEEGYPRGDIDIHGVRIARNRIASRYSCMLPTAVSVDAHRTVQCYTIIR